MNTFLESNYTALEFINLQEKLFNIDKKDIEYILKYYKQFLNTVYNQKTNEIDVSKLRDYMRSGVSYNYKTLSSKELISDQIIYLSDVEPVTINIGIFHNSNYDPVNNEIYISLNSSLVSFLIDNFGSGIISLDKLKSELPKTLQKNVDLDLNLNAMRATISHELSHWMDNKFHNKYILDKIEQRQKLLLKGNPFDIINKRTFGSKDIDTTYMEINAQIHSIETFKNQNKKYWDKWNLFDMLSLSNAFRAIYKELNRKDREDWLLKLMKRMSREGLLGKNMNYIPKDDSAMY